MKRKLRTIFLIGSLLYLFALMGLYADSYQDYDHKADYAVVFGNKVEVDGLPSARLKARLDAAKELYLSRKVKKIIVSGGVGKEGYDEAVVMAKYLKNSGVLEKDITIDSNGYDTSLTARNSWKIIGKNRCVIAVTQQYHVSRAKLSLRNAGFSCVYGYFPSYYEFRDIYSSFREIPAWVKYWVLKA